MKKTAKLFNSSGCELDEIEYSEDDKVDLEARIKSWITTIEPGDTIIFSED